MAELFGFTINRKKDKGSGDAFTTPTPDDGTVDIAGGGFFSSVLDTNGREKKGGRQEEHVHRYRRQHQGRGRGGRYQGRRPGLLSLMNRHGIFRIGRLDPYRTTTEHH